MSTSTRLHPIDAFGNSPAKTGEIRVERLEYRLKPRVPFPHRHDFYHFIFLEKASGWHEIDFTQYKAGPQQIFTVLPGQVHAWKLSKLTRGWVLEFTRESLHGDDAAGLLAALNDTPSLIEGSNIDDVQALLTQMHSEHNLALDGHRLCAEYLLKAILLKIVRKRVTVRTSRAPSLLDRFRALVEAHFKTQHTVEFYARQLGVSSKTLTTKIAKLLGRPPSVLIQDRCLVEAKRLLAYSDLSISEIAIQIGFDDPNYFARLFRQKVEVTPGAFRKRSARSVSHR